MVVHSCSCVHGLQYCSGGRGRGARVGFRGTGEGREGKESDAPHHEPVFLVPRRDVIELRRERSCVHLPQAREHLVQAPPLAPTARGIQGGELAAEEKLSPRRGVVQARR